MRGDDEQLTQKNVAELLGYCCQADIAKIEKGGRAGGRLVDPIELENLAAIYGKSWIISRHSNRRVESRLARS